MRIIVGSLAVFSGTGISGSGFYTLDSGNVVNFVMLHLSGIEFRFDLFNRPTEAAFLAEFPNGFTAAEAIGFP